MRWKNEQDLRGLVGLPFEWGAFRCYLLISAPAHTWIDRFGLNVSCEGNSALAQSEPRFHPVCAFWIFSWWQVKFSHSSQRETLFILSQDGPDWFLSAVKIKPVWCISSKPSPGAPGQRIFYSSFFAIVLKKQTNKQKTNLEGYRNFWSEIWADW